MSTEMPKEGDEAPDFTLPDQNGTPVHLADLRGQPVVLFFYPRAMTPGCTNEARDFSALKPEFDKAGARVLGISKDSVERQKKFAEKEGLTVTLLSDAESDVCERYGVWKEKTNYGKTYMGIERTTFLIGPGGRILRVWPKVKVAGHAAEVLEAVRAL